MPVPAELGKDTPIVIQFTGQGVPRTGEVYAKYYDTLRSQSTEAADIVDDILGMLQKPVTDHGLGYDLVKELQTPTSENYGYTSLVQSLSFGLGVAATDIAIAFGFILPDQILAVEGHSVGEYAAADRARVLPRSVLANAIVLRGQGMHVACERFPSQQLSVAGLSLSEGETLAEHTGTLIGLVNVLPNGPFTFGGLKPDVQRLREEAQARTLKVTEVPDSHGAFHHPILEEDTRGLRNHLGELIPQANRELAYPFISNVTGQATTDGRVVLENMIKGILGRVEWAGCVQTAKDMGGKFFLESGPGSVLQIFNRYSGIDKKQTANVASLF